MKYCTLHVRNMTEAIPELLRLVIREGEAPAEVTLAQKGDARVVKRPVAVRYERPFEGVVAWPQWPDSPLELFHAAVLNAGTMPMGSDVRGEDSGVQGPLTFFINFERTNLLDAAGRIPVCVSMAMRLCQVWRKTPVQYLQLTFDGIESSRELLDLVGELLLKVEPYPELGRKIDPIDEKAAEELAAFAATPDAIGYRSRFLRRVATPMFQARAATCRKDVEGARRILLAASTSAWVAASIDWLEARG